MAVLASAFRRLTRSVVRHLFRVRVSGLAHFQQAGARTLIVANHISRLDAFFLYLFLPEVPLFAIESGTSRRNSSKTFLGMVETFELDPLNPHTLKSLVKILKQERKVLVFPESRISATGSLMKIYEGPAMIANLADAEILPVGLEGLQYSKFSLLQGLVRLRWFPRVTIVCLPPRKIVLPDAVQGRERRRRAALAMQQMMREIAFENAYRPITLYQAVIEAMRVHGARRTVVEDSTGANLNYRQLLLRANVLRQFITTNTEPSDCIGILLPSTAAAIVVLVAIQSCGRSAALLNFTAGARGLVIACETARIKTIYTSRKFVTDGGVETEVAALEDIAELRYLEDLRDRVSIVKKLRAAASAYLPTTTYHWRQKRRDPNDVSVILFTSGSEGIPKGVLLSHSNLLANRAQVQTLIDLNHRDIVLNVLPMFHAFGLLGGILLPLLDGAKIYCYPSPLHYRVIPELSYRLGATFLFGTNTFLAGYATHAHPYDFHKMRYVVAGAEKLTDATRRTWSEKLGIRIFEGYGATEASPVVAVNTPMGNKPNSVGQLLAKIEYYLEPVDGITDGGRLIVKGPNIMRGYLFHGSDGKPYPPATDVGQGWYDTGDIVKVDDDGEFVTIIGRQKRFAKIGGEMVSLRVCEELALEVWPDSAHAAVALPDSRKGETVVLLSEYAKSDRSTLVSAAKKHGVSELAIPKKVVHCEKIPLLGSGKVDYPALKDLAKELLGH